MPKKCSSCGFLDNPDHAHFCGKCGKNIKNYEYWMLYDYHRYTPVEKSKLKEYELYEQEAKLSIWKKMWKSVKDFWRCLDTPEWLKELFGFIMCCIFVGIIWSIGYGIITDIRYLIELCH